MAEIQTVVYDGKYTFVQSDNDYRVKCLRYGEQWMVIEKGSNAINALLYEFSNIKAENKRLKEELEKHHWIPVTEKLPKKNGYYLVCDGIWYGRMFFDGRWCFGNKTQYPYSEHLTHWKPIVLPEQMKKEN